jgi:hypothetical protein
MTVVCPLNESSPFTGTVVGPVKTSNIDPDTMVKLPGRTGTEVAEERTTIVVPDITVVLPSNGMFGFTGTVVGPVKTANVEPAATVMLPGSAGIVVWCGMTKRGVPFTTVVLPVSPGGAFCTGIEVGGITITGVPFDVMVLPIEGLGGAGAPLITELIIDPIEGVVVGGGIKGGLRFGVVVVVTGIAATSTSPECLTVEVVESVKSPPIAVWITISKGFLHASTIGRIEGPAGRHDVRSGYSPR